MTARQSGEVRVGVAGAGEVITAGLRSLLSAEPWVQVDELVPGADVDVVVYDVFALHADDGRDLSSHVAAGTPVLALGRPLRPDLAARAHALGAAGTVSIEAEAPDLVKVLHDVAEGKPLSAGSRSPAPASSRPDHGLTPRQVTVLRGIARGLDNRAIGEELSISLNTVKTVIRAAYGRIGVTTRSQAVCWAIQHGYGPGEPARR